MPDSYPNGIVPGDPVVISVSHMFKGYKTGFVLTPIKWCQEGVPVYLADDRMTTRYVCVVEANGDTIRKL